jgi:hypothetical protein
MLKYILGLKRGGKIKRRIQNRFAFFVAGEGTHPNIARLLKPLSMISNKNQGIDELGITIQSRMQH